MILDGKKLAAEILARTKTRALGLPHPPKVVALIGRESAATRSYLRIKAARATDAGCTLEVRPYPANFADADSVIIQLPLAENLDTKEVLDAIPLAKDADVLSSAAREKFARDEEGALLPPVVGAMKEIFEQYEVELRGKRAVVIGRGWLVGEPAAVWLAQQGARVTTLDRAAKLGQDLPEADIIVCGAGSPHLIKPYMLKEGVVLVDAGTSEQGGALAGDADPSCVAKCSIFTPVPGGVGPVAVAKLFENAVILAEHKVFF
ncbi:MAG: tetrahydrofolate dehydrogenase/cyclohydrolase catalytic domain-containing protein [Minisyncoccia bacterium]